jgi:hypothetical protein
LASAIGLFAAALPIRTATAGPASAGDGVEGPRPDLSARNGADAKATLDATPAPETAAARRWYGYQLMLSDAGSLAAALALAHSEGGVATAVGAGGFLVVPIGVHLEHRNARMAIASPLLRSLLPILGAAVGMGLETCSPGEWFCGLGGALLGGGVGMLTAMTIDYALAIEGMQRPAPHAPPGHATSPSRNTGRPTAIVAGLAPTKAGAAVVLGGRF